MATLNLTRKCNLKCKHCYNGHQKLTQPQLNEMSSQQIGKIIAILGKAIKNEPKLLIISGGEPTLKPEKVETAVSVAYEC